MSEPLANIMPEIPPWTYQDYACSLVPYEYIYAMRADPVRQRQTLEIVCKRAQMAGYRAYKTTYTEYLKTLQASGNNPFASTTDFEGQPIELSCSNYVCDDLGVRTESEQGIIKVCPHPILPVRRLINIDTGEVKQELAFKRGGGWRTAIFDKTTLSSAQKVTGLSAWGIGVNSESARDFVKYICQMEDENYDALPEARSVGRLGWVKGYGFSPYVSGLVFDGSDQYKHAFDCVRPEGSWEEWLKLAKRVRVGKSLVCRVALAASFASVLVDPLDALPFIVHLWGGAGAGKTVGLMLAASVWARPTVGDYVKSFNGTVVSYELMAAFCGSLPLCLDELQCVKDRKSFDDMIYMLCEGAGKARGAKGGGLQRLTSWRNCTISTGEQPLTNAQSGAGAMNRVIELDCKDEKLFDDPHAAVGIVTRNYGHAGKHFVDAIQADGMMDVLKTTQEALYEQLAGKCTDKQALSASILLTADAMAEMTLFEDGNTLTADDIIPFLTTNYAADANRRAYEYILGVVAANPMRFKTSAYGDYQGECWGKIEGKQTFINKMIFNRLMNEGGFNVDSFLGWAKRNHYIECSQGHTTKQKRINGSDPSIRCVCLLNNYGIEEGEVIDDDDL